MPELPEVETIKRGITPCILNKSIQKMVIRKAQLRWPITSKLPSILKDQKIINISRRSKYLLIETTQGTLIVHLGMSGTLCFHNKPSQLLKHDHVDIIFEDGGLLRYNDPRRFGAILWTDQPINEHRLFKDLGPEPLSNDFNAEYFFVKTRKRKTNIKPFIMDSHIVVGVGNIYANEALFMAGIRPTRQTGRITKTECTRLVKYIKQVLRAAIKQGGTTLKDYRNSDGKPGYFRIKLNVYGKKGQPCPNCKTTLKEIRISGRSTVYCCHCQK